MYGPHSELLASSKDEWLAAGFWHPAVSLPTRFLCLIRPSSLQRPLTQVASL